MSSLKVREEHEWVRPIDEKYNTRVCTKCGRRSTFYTHDKSECSGKKEVMSDLREKIKIQIGSAMIIGSEKTVTSERRQQIIQENTDQILAAFKAHIEEHKLSNTDISTHTRYGVGYYHGWEAAIDEYHKKLLRSLESKDAKGSS